MSRPVILDTDLGSDVDDALCLSLALASPELEIVGITDERLPSRWSLVCRDAFNGKLLWKRPLGPWGSASMNVRCHNSSQSMAQSSRRRTDCPRL